MQIIRLSNAQRSAIELCGSIAVPEAPEDFALCMAFRGATLEIDPLTASLVWRALNEESNAADDAAEYGYGDEFSKRVARSFSAIARKVKIPLAV